jgi:DNA sulfur modification protein DndD
MRIISIELNDFISFKGNQLVEFNRGLNLFNGNIGSGKSSLYNAFYWCLYNKIYVTDEGWQEKINHKKIINLSSLNSLNDGDEIECFVKLTIENPNEEVIRMTQSDDNIYEIKRTFTLKKNKDDFDISKSEFEIHYNNKTGSEFLDPPELYVELCFIPNVLSEYIWFQGESIDKLLDLDHSNSFKDVVNSISYIDMYDKILTVLNRVNDKFEKKLRIKQRSTTANVKAFNEAEQNLFKNEKILIEEKKIQDKYIIEQDEISLKKANLKNKLLGFDKTRDLIAKREQINEKLGSVLEDIANLDNLAKQSFSNSWMMKGLTPFLKDSAKKLLEFEDWRNKQFDKEQELPEDVPGPVYIEKMLKQEKCLVCGRPAKEGTDEHKHIASRLNKKNPSKILDPETERMNKYVVSLRTYPHRLTNKLDAINFEIENYRDKDIELTKKRRILRKRKKEIDKEISVFEKQEGFKIDNHSTNSVLLVNSLNSHEINDKKIGIRLRESKERERQAKNEIKSIKSILARLSGGEKNDLSLEKKNLKESEVLINAVETTKGTEYEKLIRDIEQRSNNYISKILENNSSIKAKVEIDAKSNIIEITDLNDEELSLLNTGHKTIIKMSIINAIISKSSEYKNESFPFLTDAPTSNLGVDDTLSYVNLISNIFDQSIVLSKDLSEKIDTLKINNKITSIFNFTPVNIDKTKNAVQENTYTLIEKIK